MKLYKRCSLKINSKSKTINRFQKKSLRVTHYFSICFLTIFGLLKEFLSLEQEMNSREQLKHKQPFEKAKLIKFRTDVYDESKQMTNSMENQVTQRTFEQNTKENQEKSNKFERSYYLESSDLKEFGKHLESLTNQLNVLEKLLKDDDIIGEFDEKAEDFTNLGVLISKIKENTLKNDTYTSLLTILQK